MARNLADGLREVLENKHLHPMVPLLRKDELSSMVGWILYGKLTPTDDKPIHPRILEARELKRYWVKKGLSSQRIVEICVDYIMHNERTLKTISEISWKKDPWSPYVSAVLVNGPMKKEPKPKRNPDWDNDEII